MTTQKAIRATFKLGKTELDGFQKPDNSYCLNQTQVCEIVQKDKRSMRNFLASESPLAIPYKALSGGKSKGTNLTKLFVQGDTAQNITEVPLDLAFAYWLKEASQGNTLALDLVAACGIEALERRLDAAFGVQRSEQERNERLKTRTQGKVARRYLTDSIADYLESHPDLSDNYRKYIWSNCSDHLNLIILGAKSKQAKEFLEVPPNSLLRNHIPVAALNELERVEDLASRIIDEKGTEPLEAVKEAAILMFTKSIGMI